MTRLAPKITFGALDPFGTFGASVPPLALNVTVVTAFTLSTSNVGPVVLTENVTVHVVFVVLFTPVTVTCTPSRHAPVNDPLTTSNGVDDEMIPVPQSAAQLVYTALGGLTMPL